MLTASCKTGRKVVFALCEVMVACGFNGKLAVNWIRFFFVSLCGNSGV